ncbi:MAG: urease accessory protein UreD [Pseudomonadota bacterium]
MDLRAKRRGAETVIGDLHQKGSLKALFPKVRGNALDAVFLNTAGGLTGGDRFDLAIACDAGAHTVVSSQAAERAYRAMPGQVAQVRVSLDVAAGGRVDWLPQETIIFDQSALSRRLDVRLSGDATALLVEPVILGRTAMGEIVHQMFLSDHWRVWRDGHLVFADAVRLNGDAQALMAGKATGNGAGAMATVLLAGPQAAQAMSKIDLAPESGASLIADDLLLIRLLAQDGFALRRQLIPVVEALATGPLPRVWRL